MAVGAAAAALLVALAGCSAAGSDADAACEDPSPAPAAETALMPEGLSFDKIGTVTHVEKADANTTVRAISAKPIDEVTVLIQDAVTSMPAGYRPAGMDNEGDEAEVFFNSGAIAAGQAQVREADCEGKWNIELVLIDPGAVSSPAPAPDPT
ncbi:MAG TPA: hypothetical protein VH969_27920 [Actinophytocola sp.]|jgi:hypothetical protein|uniref:hypothetical protein n=1 Tax=Actinophytocola sp. TaxID=1872138 RepID=UPI002F91E0C0